MNLDDHTWMLVTKKVANEASAKELAELDALLKQNQVICNSLKMLDDWWCAGDEHVDDNTTRQFKKIMTRIKNVDDGKESGDSYGA